MLWQLCGSSVQQKRMESNEVSRPLQRALYSFAMRYKHFMWSQFSASTSQKTFKTGEILSFSSGVLHSRKLPEESS